MKETLNEEQEAQAKKEAGTSSMQVFRCVVKRAAKKEGDIDETDIYVEANRWFDARAFAIRVLGVTDVECARTTKDMYPRWQIRWVGTKATGTTDPLRLQKRHLKRQDDDPSWRDA